MSALFTGRGHLSNENEMQLIAMKKIRYPKRGPDAVEYMPGDSFQTLTDRDAKALLITRVAKEAPKPAAKKTLTLKPAGPVEAPAAAPAKTLDTAAGSYQRRDMRPIEE